MTSLSRHPIPSSLSVLALGASALIALPLLYVAYTAASADLGLWSRLWGTRIPELLTNTVTLALTVALSTLLLGVSLAWLVTRFQFPGRALWDWLLVLPIAIPSYVLAYIYTYLLGYGGPVETLWRVFAGPEARVMSPYSYGGVSLVMTLNTFPFVYLLARAAFLNFNVSFEEVARATGASRTRTLFRVSLPLIRPALVAGVALVVLYVVSDFGAVSLLRYQTFTYAVYQQVTGRYDHTAASVLSVLLVGFALVFLIAERWFRRRSRFYQTTGRYRHAKPHPCGPLGAILVIAYPAVVFSAAFGIPIVLLGFWSMTAVADGVVDSRFWEFIWNSALLSTLAATCAVIVGTPLAFLASRYPTRFNQLCLQAAYTGYVLPGPVAALALLVLFSHLLPVLYGTALVLILAYVIHFLPVGLQAMESALQQVTPNVEEAARSLGHNPLRTFQRVTLPLVGGGFAVAWILMFIHSMKELPATLLLRPVGFDTLAVRIWMEASEEYYQLAAPAALLIVVVTLPAILFLVSKDRHVA